MDRSSAARRRAPGTRWLRLGGAAVAVALLAALPGTTAAADPAPSTAYPGGTWAPPPATYGTSTDENHSVQMDDGAILKVDVTYPTDPATGTRLPGPFPVVLNQDPYTGSALVPARAVTGTTPNYYVQRGYIYVHLHQRGTGGPGETESEGYTDLAFGPRHGLDGVAIAYWAADPRNVPGSDGTVGLQGCSALGVIQLSTLAKLGELQRTDGRVWVPGPTIDDSGRWVPVTARSNPIKAAIPECFTHSEYFTQFTDNGVPTTQAAVSFLAPVAGVALFGLNTDNPSSGLVPTSWSIDTIMGGDYAYNRSFWQERDWLRNAADIGRTGVPVLLWVGYKESGFMSAQPLYAALQNFAAGRPVTAPMLPGQKTSPKYQVIIGDWSHGVGIDPGIELQWLDTWVRGDDTGLRSASGSLMLKELPSAATERWIGPGSYPISTAHQALYLDRGALPTDAGGLSRTKPIVGGADQLVWPAGPSLDYTSAAFDEDTTLLAPTAARFWVRTSTTNVQLYVELQDVAPDGSATPITHGSILGSRSQTAAVDAGRTWTAPNGLPMLPWLSLDDDRYLAPDTAVKLDVPLQPVTWRLRKDHRLRVLVGASAGARCAPTQNPTGSPVPTGCMLSLPVAQSLVGGVFQVLRDSAHPSLLNAALVPSDQLPTIASGPTGSSEGEAEPLGW